MSVDDKKLKQLQESAATPAVSPTKKQTPETKVSTESDVKEGKSSPPPKETKVSGEEAEWSKLSGNSQDRFKELIIERNQLKDQVGRQAEDDQQQVTTTQQPIPQTQAPSDDEVQGAINKLREKGMATQEDIEQVKNQIMGWTHSTNLHNQLENDYSGKDGRPKYDRVEVEDYARKHGYGWNYKAAFQSMYHDELIDWEVKKRGTKRATVKTQKPTASVAGVGEPLTLDSLRTKLAGPEGRKLYEKLAKNPKGFDALVKELTGAES